MPLCRLARCVQSPIIKTIAAPLFQVTQVDDERDVKRLVILFESVLQEKAY